MPEAPFPKPELGHQGPDQTEEFWAEILLHPEATVYRFICLMLDACFVLNKT
jgi:hypothetical protein